MPKYGQVNWQLFKTVIVLELPVFSSADYSWLPCVSNVIFNACLTAHRELSSST